MDYKHQINIELFRIHVDKFLKGREIKWKLVISFWGAIGAMTTLLFGRVSPSPYEVWLISASVLLLFILWIFPISLSIKRDRELYSKYRAHLESAANEPNPAKKHVFFYRPDKRDIGEFLITLLIVLICGYLLSSAPDSSQLTNQCSSQPAAAGMVQSVTAD